MSGALIGLLFVAISVVPHGVRTSDKATARLRPAAALSAFTNALLISLLALVPGLSLAGAVTALSTVGLIAMTALVVLLFRETGIPKHFPELRAFLVVIGQGVIYGFQLAQGIALSTRPDDLTAVDNIAVLIVVLFALGIERSWEYVGARTPNLLAAVTGFDPHSATDRPNDTKSAVPPAQDPSSADRSS